MAQAQGQSHNEATHTPETSYWPIVLAAFLTLTVAGLIVHVAISLLGALLSLAAMVAWTLERFQGPTRIGLRPDGLGVSMQVAATGTRLGQWALVWFIATEALLFVNLIAAYLYLRLSSPGWPLPDIPHRDLLFPSLNTAILLLSGLPAYYAQQAMKRGDRRGLQTRLILAALLGAVFLGGQGYEYTVVGFSPQTNAVAAGFFVLTGLHGLHVVAGIGLLLFVLLLSVRGHFSSRRSFTVEVASTYWHFVDVVWIFLFSLLYVFQ